MQRLYCGLIFSFMALTAVAQYRNDNVLYKTIYPQDLCRELEKNPGYLLLDVRSAGEYSDTSASTSLNIGHLNKALNIDIRQISNRLQDIKAYKDKPVFVYCSHSQRSRRVSKMLADSGFTHINNINGGMTALYQLNDKQRDCLKSMISTGNAYGLVSVADLCNNLASRNSQVYLLDVRPDSAWKHIASNPKFNAYGYLKGTQHLALDQLKSQLASLPKDREFIITDLFGADAAVAAKLLKENGFEKVSVLLEGIDRWLYTDKSSLSCAKDLYVPAVPFSIISTGEFAQFQKVAKNYLVLDVRSADEFANRHADGFRNIGHLQNAVNVPSAELAGRIAELEKYKSLPVIVYAFSGSPEAYAAANTLLKNEFKDVKVLAGGLFNIRWTAFNIEGMKYLNDNVVDVPSENQ